MYGSELLWLLNLFRAFNYHHLTHVPHTCDSKSALYMTSNLVFHERTKHIDIEYHLVRE